MDGKFVKSEQCRTEVLENGVVRTIKGYIHDLMVVELRWKKGMEGSVHTHAHKQCSYVIEGEFEASVGDAHQIMRVGDCVYMDANVPHGIRVLSETGILLDIFSPMREDFLE